MWFQPIAAIYALNLLSLRYKLKRLMSANGTKKLTYTKDDYLDSRLIWLYRHVLIIYHNAG